MNMYDCEIFICLVENICVTSNPCSEGTTCAPINDQPGRFVCVSEIRKHKKHGSK